MRARLTAVQQALLLLPVVSLILAVLARPHLENRHFMAALEEVSAFRARFDRSTVEASLRQAAEKQGLVELTALPGAVKSAGGPKKLQVAQDAAPVRPLTFLQVNNLAAVYGFAQPQSQLKIGAPDAAAMGPAIAWRLMRAGESGPFTITSVQLAPAGVTAQDVDLESEVAQLAVARSRAQTALDQATKRLTNEETILEARRKRRLPWKVIVKSVEAVKEAKDALAERTQALTAANESYESAAARALAEKKPSTLSKVPEFALANVQATSGAEHITLQIPVRLERRSVMVPALQHSDFAATREAELWDEVKGLDPAGAEQAIRSHFNWHHSNLGMLVLQLLPCLLPALLALLLRRIRAAAASYSPFNNEVQSELPRVGLKSRGMEGVALVLLPLLAGVSATSALLVIGQVPVLPVVAAVACLLMGGFAFGKLGDLQELVESVMHSHSYPPPPAPKPLAQP